jgi:hypothetical protein
LPHEFGISGSATPTAGDANAVGLRYYRQMLKGFPVEGLTAGMFIHGSHPYKRNLGDISPTDRHVRYLRSQADRENDP